MNKKNVPDVRFPGFLDEWKQCKFSEVLDTENIKPYIVEALPEGKYPVIQQGDNPILGYNDGEPFKEYEKVVLFGDHTLSLYKPKTPFFVATDGIKIFSGTNGMNGEFLNSLLQAYMPDSEGYKRHFSILKEKVSYFPEDHLEQNKIGQLFELLDTVVVSEQRKLDEIKKLKTGLLQIMFPQKTEKVPKIRFPGFNGDWEQRKLGEVVQITMGQSPDGKTYSEEPSDYILVQGNADLINGWVTPRIWTTQVTKKGNAGDLIMSVRAPAGAIGKTAYDVVLGRGVAALDGNEFIYQQLFKMDKEGYWKKFSCGSTFESLNSDHLKNALVWIPSEEEQKKIGSFLNDLDQTITLHQQKIDDLNRLKAGLLQKMFI